MVETNIRIVKGGATLRVAIRRAQVTATQQRPDLCELACIRLRQRHHLAAVPLINDPTTLLVAATQEVPKVQFEEENWELRVEDAGTLEPLEFESDLGREALPLLVERAVLDAIATRTARWSIAGRPRHFYEPRPIETGDGVAVWK